MEKYRFYKSINTEKGYEKYIRTTSERCTVILLGGTLPIIERFEKPYPVFDNEPLEDCTSSEFYEKADNVRQRKLNFTARKNKTNSYKSILVIASLILLSINTLLISCITTHHLPTRGWTIAYIYDNGLGYHTTFLSVPNALYIAEQQFDTIVGNVGDSVLLYGTNRIRRIEK